MCGSENRLYKAEIEGTVLNVCPLCAKFGRVVAGVHDKQFIEKRAGRRERERPSRPLISQQEMVQDVVEDFAKIIKEKREFLGLKQEDFAKKINEKESIIHKIETGHFEPNIKLARKIEKFLKVKLIGQQDSESVETAKSQSKEFTLGDFIKVRK